MTSRRGAHLAVAAALLLGSALVTLLLARTVSARLERPGIVLLGSGDSLSVLLTVGRARLLLPAGNEPASFGNAWRAWTTLPLTSRVDVLALPAEPDEVATWAIDRLAVRQTIAFRAVVERTGSPSGATLVEDVARIALGDDASVTMERWIGQSSEDHAWRLIVERGSTRVAVLPNGAAATRFTWPAPISTVVLIHGPVDGAIGITGAASVVVPSRVSGKTLRAEPAATRADGFWGVRVDPGEAVRLGFTQTGLRLPDEAEWYDGEPADAPAPALAVDRLDWFAIPKIPSEPWKGCRR